MAIFLITLTILLTCAVEQYLWPASVEQRALAERYRVPRRHLESLRSWETRTFAAAMLLHAADDAFVAEAQKLGMVDRISERGLRWSLPSAHPAAIALTAARYPDGPSPEEIERLMCGTCTQIGVDLSLP
jgi:hypothetical protein